MALTYRYPASQFYLEKRAKTYTVRVDHLLVKINEQMELIDSLNAEEAKALEFKDTDILLA